MSKSVILKEKHGEYEPGSAFEVFKEGPSTTIVEAPNGKRIILPNSKLDLAVPSAAAVIVINEKQAKVLAALSMCKGNLDDILEEYMKESGLEEHVAQSDICFLEDHRTKGSSFVLDGSMAPGPAMSAAERTVLETLLSGDTSKWSDPVLGVTVTEEPPAPEPTLGDNQIWFTDVTKGRLPKSGINHIIKQYDPEHFPEDMRADIPQVNDEHFWDTEVLEALILSHQLREKALITGMPGTGKSSSVQQFAAWIRQPYMRLGGRGDLEAASFLGQSWVDLDEVDGKMVSKMVFKPGMLAQGLNYKGFGYLVTIDEVWKIPAYIQMAMQHLYEKDGYLTIDDKPGDKRDKIVKPAPEFLLILTDNVKGTGDNFDKFAATQMQDTSSLDRIGINETLDYLKQDDEEAMLRAKFPAQDKTLIKRLVKFANLVRNGYKGGSIALTLSPRGLIAILDMVSIGVPLERAISLAFSNKLADETEQIAVGDMRKTVGF